MISGSDLQAAIRLVTTLPRTLRRRPTPALARRVITHRLQTREQRFLQSVERALSPRPTGRSPYATLLQWAGCELRDVTQLVARDGLEATLRVLLDRGVFVHVEELKGRRPIIRGSSSLSVTADDFRSTTSHAAVPARTGGSRSPGTPVFIDLAFIEACALDLLAFLDARGGSQWRKATWESPGAGAMFRMLKLSSFGEPAARWFSQVREDDPGLHPRYRWSSRAITWESRMLGIPVPSPRYVPLSDPQPIVDWLAATRREGQVPYLHCFASAAAAICQQALRAGIDISGSQLLAMGEPFTPARLAMTRTAGVHALPRYGCIEAGPIGYGCEQPVDVDEVHVLRDLHAVVQPAGDSTQPRPLYITSLSPAAPFQFFNVNFGDAGVLLDRGCGCPLESLGWSQHLHSIRSLEKLTAGGTNLLDVDIIHILEHDLPTSFGGAAIDYQLVEEELPDGRPRLRLLVSPGIEAVDEREVARVFMDAIAAHGGAEHLMARVFEGLDALRVERRAPISTQSGKVLHVHKLPPAT